MDQDKQRRERLEGLYATHAAVVRAYVRRRTDAATVAWRRLDQLPQDPVPWLLACARNALATNQRGEHRRAALIARLTTTAARSGVRIEDGRSALAEAFATLGERDREALLLIAWDGLTPDQAAGVLGCSRRTFAMRLHRARKRLSAALLAVDRVDTPTLMETCND
jgi:RNA polymerase sigma-70 factor (ECF subfamily)